MQQLQPWGKPDEVFGTNRVGTRIALPRTGGRRWVKSANGWTRCRNGSAVSSSGLVRGNGPEGSPRGGWRPAWGGWRPAWGGWRPAWGGWRPAGRLANCAMRSTDFAFLARRRGGHQEVAEVQLHHGEKLDEITRGSRAFGQDRCVRDGCRTRAREADHRTRDHTGIPKADRIGSR